MLNKIASKLVIDCLSCNWSVFYLKGSTLLFHCTPSDGLHNNY